MCWNWPRRPIKGLSDGMDDSIIRYASTKVGIYIGFENMCVQNNFEIICNVERIEKLFHCCMSFDLLLCHLNT